MKRLKKVLLIITGSVVLLFMLAWVAAWFFEDDVKSLIVKNINSSLTTPVTVKDVQFSFIRKFPSATLEFTDVVMDGAGFKETGHAMLKEIGRAHV